MNENLYLNRVREIMGSSFSDESIKIENSKLIKENEFEVTGNWLFKYRSFIPLIIIP